MAVNHQEFLLQVRYLHTIWCALFEQSHFKISNKWSYLVPDHPDRMTPSCQHHPSYSIWYCLLLYIGTWHFSVASECPKNVLPGNHWVLSMIWQQIQIKHTICPGCIRASAAARWKWAINGGDSQGDHVKPEIHLCVLPEIPAAKSTSAMSVAWISSNTELALCLEHAVSNCQQH